MLSRFQRLAVVAAAVILCFVLLLQLQPLPFVRDYTPKLSHIIPSLGHSDNGTIDRYWTRKGENLFAVPQVKRPKNVEKIMGLVFYGRRNTVSILECYLQRNLVKNGGLLDGVVFVERTTDEEDLALLHRMVEEEPAYEVWHVDLGGKDNFANGFGQSYDRIEDNVLYIKMDDDIVFIEDNVIPSLIQTKLDHPEYYVVSANIINQPLLSWVHWSLGAIRPYLPEVDAEGKPIKVENAGTKPDWRASTYPAWNGPSEYNSFKFVPPEDGLHRWLPLPNSNDHILDSTPVEETEYDAHGKGWTQWQIGAQEHYSFLENLEKNDLSRYTYGIWDFQYKRMGIQFIAIMGNDINIAKPIEGDDENQFACTMPRKLGRHAVADGRGVAVHYSFGSQRNGMKRTDVLERYRSFARENICMSPMKWEPKP